MMVGDAFGGRKMEISTTSMLKLFHQDRNGNL